MAYKPCKHHPLGCSADFVFVLEPLPLHAPQRGPMPYGYMPMLWFGDDNMDNDLCAALVVAEIIERTGTEVVAQTEHQFTPAGITVAYVLSSSHLVVHTYPERQSIVVSVNVCSEDAVAAVKKMDVAYWRSFFDENNIRLDSCTVRFNYIKHEGGTGCLGWVKRTLRELFS